MIRTSILVLILIQLQAQQAIAQRPISDESITIDSVKSGASIYNRITDAVLFIESYIIEKIGRDNFYSNYKFDSTFNDVLWTSVDNGKYSKHSKSIKSDNSYVGSIEDFSDNLRIVYHYNFSYKNIQYPKRGFGLQVQLAGDKSAINVQGLIRLTKERNLTNVLTRDEVLEKIRKTKFKKEVRKSIKKNITVNQITYDFDQFKGESFEKIYYTILIKDIKEPAFYKFDPWTGELCCIVKTKAY